MASKVLSSAELYANRLVVLSSYRHLLRATRIAFNNDNRMLLASRKHARSQFEAGRMLETGSVQAAQGVEHAQGVTKILRENVVQGTNVGGEKYKLNIHEHTERGDNDTAGKLKGTSKSWKEVKDAAF